MTDGPAKRRFGMRTMFVVVICTVTLISVIVGRNWRGHDETAQDTEEPGLKVESDWWQLPRNPLEQFIKEQIANARHLVVRIEDSGPNGRFLLAEVDIHDTETLNRLSQEFAILSEPDHPDLYSTSKFVSFTIIGDRTTHYSLTADILMYGPPSNSGSETDYPRSHTVVVPEKFVADLEKVVGVPFVPRLPRSSR